MSDKKSNSADLLKILPYIKKPSKIFFDGFLLRDKKYKILRFDGERNRPTPRPEQIRRKSQTRTCGFLSVCLH